ncbi:MAG: hypothetical protein CVU36_24295 [Betaproteobacteria bacterium HGW-Betaproteobacteria-9]|nr:MAG: hypothetical protein CVV12_11125 [Gammaproteobacteria bacterium HGW-Gammaproteobacteria-2]PKO26449.1 MAG: hypothetical protein CVU36_24295 [Betaproteobacteria bacterium HGW-Betaproteobacteria-9]
MVGFLAVLGVEPGGPLIQNRALPLLVGTAIGGVQLAATAVDVLQFLGAYLVPLLQGGVQLGRYGSRLLLFFIG